MLAGAKHLIVAATRHRRMLGGAMRQVGIFAAAALHGLDHHRERMVEDHANARLFAGLLAASPAIEIDLASVQTNIIVFKLAPGAIDADALVARARECGLLLNAFGGRAIRAVTHLDVSREQAQRGAAVLLELLSQGRSQLTRP